MFSRALNLAPGRLHFAAHSHHLWPDASFEGQTRAWEDANRHADRKWDLIFGEVVPEAQSQVAAELNLPDPSSLVFASSTHDLLVRLFSGLARRPARVLATDGEFHSFRRQADRWVEAGAIELTRVAAEPFEDFEDRFLAAARDREWDVILVSQVFFRSGRVVERLGALADMAGPSGPWVVVDGYHGFMALPTDLGPVADRLCYLAGGYKYAMSGEGACFLYAPPGVCTRPVTTGWFAEFGALEGAARGVPYRTDAGRLWGATFDPSALYRFNAVRQMLADQGLSTADVSAHAAGLQGRFMSAVGAGEAGALADAERLNPFEPGRSRARFLAFRDPRALTWRQALLDAGVVTDVREDVIRFGFGLYQDPEDVDALIAACGRTLS